MAVALCLAAPALAAEPKPPKIPKSVLVEAARAAPGGRGVDVVVGQAEIASNINPSFATLAMGGGVLGVIIDAKVDSDRAKRAMAGITPLRTALIDVDVDQLAIDTTKAATATLPWFEGKDPEFARDPTIPAKSAVLSAGAARQVAFFDYVYDTAPDFSSIRVGVRITLANKDAPNGGAAETRLNPKNLAYDQTLTSVVRLGNPGAPPDNAERWAAHDGVLAKKALKVAFAEVGVLIPRALTLGVDDIAKMDAGAKKTIGGYAGKVQEETPDGALLFNGGLVHIQTVAE
jgi:hypothetical protein